MVEKSAENIPRCPTCGRPHVTKRGTPACAGHAKHKNPQRQAERGVKPGDPCKLPPEAGSTVCRWHGANTPQAKRARAARVAEAQARHEVELFAGRRDIHPAEALLELVQWTAGEVDYWRQQVRLLERDQIAGNLVTKVESGQEKGQHTHLETTEAAEHIAYRMLKDASDRLAKYAAAALKAGVEERRVRLAEAQGSLVAEVIRAILTDLSLNKRQQALVATVVPKHLRALTTGAA